MIGSASIWALMLAVAGNASAAAAQLPEGDREAPDLPPAESASAEEQVILVTATRVERTGFFAPTPTTIVGQEEFELSGETDIGSFLRELPLFKATEAPSTQGNNSSRIGGNFVNMRGLGPARTLVLVNGRRHVSTNSSGWVDINAIPTILLDRVEIVTGGASAAWGSDAVAGVVNLILDREVQGIRTEAQSGITQYGDNHEYRVALAAGTSFLNGRGHFTIGAEASESEGILDQSDRPWSAREWQVITNPAFTPTNGEPRLLVTPNVHIALASLGGLIVSGPLAGTQFLAGGVPAPFTFGQRAGLNMIGGDGVNMGQFSSLSVPFDRQAVFAHSEFDLSDDVRVWAEGSFARSHSRNDVVMPFDFGNLRITRENAFLPESIRQQMIATGQQFFNMGRINVDMGFYTADVTTETWRGAVGLDGSLGGSWRWDAHYQYGTTDYVGLLRGRITDRFLLSVDSVIDPATGQPACRVNADANPANDAPGCVPVNLFGFGAPQQEAIDWFFAQGRQDIDIVQHTAGANLRGEPFATWAGPVSLAGGVEYRKESVDSRSDPLSVANRFQIGNTQPLAGELDVKEAYVETVIPLLRESPVGHGLELNAAYRLTDYSTSGTVSTWKIGATYSITEALRLRATRSRDIAAPNALQLFTGNQLAFGTVIFNGASVFVSRLIGGNPVLEPEKADTLTAGIVYSPPWLRGLRLSADYYEIDIDGAIGVLGLQDTLDRCEAGNTEICQLVIRDGAGIPTQILQPLLNLDRLIVRGVDMELSYVTPLERLIPGELALRLLVSHVMDFIRDDGRTAIDTAGDLSVDVNGLPRWRANATATYRLEPFTFQLQGHFVGRGFYNQQLGPNDINDNTVRSAFFLDAVARYAFPTNRGIRAELFLGVDNVLNSAPPIVTSTFVTPPATNNAFYDVAGRTFTVGGRFRF